MWVCDDCLENTDIKTAVKSRGQCEVCGKAALCNDVITHLNDGDEAVEEQ